MSFAMGGRRSLGFPSEDPTAGGSGVHPLGGPGNFLDGYVESMPASYRRRFDDASIETHAGIVERRGRVPVRLEAWKQMPGGVVAICVVADDEPGLLSRICAAVFAHGADIVAAQAYGRVRNDFVMEAIAFLWLRRVLTPSGSVVPIQAHDVARLAETLQVLIQGDLALPHAVPRACGERAERGPIVVAFDGEAGEGAVLTVQADDQPGLLLAIMRALLHARVEVLSSQVETERGRARDRFVVAEPDGTRLTGERLLALEVAVSKAVDETATESS
jgi:UTP:GlnB (protein PII) uridylyltransferase